MKLRVCRRDEVPPAGEMLGVPVDGLDVDVLVTERDGEVVAASSMCPHEDVSLLDGYIDGDQVACPGHGYLFDLRDGACHHDPSLRLRIYRTEVVDGEVWIDLLRSPG